MRHENLWIDTDPSGLVWTGLDCDDDLAILIALAIAKNSKNSSLTNNDSNLTSTAGSTVSFREKEEDESSLSTATSTRALNLSLAGISVCGGNAPLAHTWDDIHALWDYIDFETYDLSTIIRPVKGYGWNAMQISRPWLKFLNLLSPDIDDSNDAVEAIVNAITIDDELPLPSNTEQSRNTELTILTLGPPTNVAKSIATIQWRAEQGVEQSSYNSDTTHRRNMFNNLKHVYMMGGELTGQRLDLNFMTDRGAARTIIEASDVPVTLIPIQLCGQVIVTKDFVERFETDCCCPSRSSSIMNDGGSTAEGGASYSSGSSSSPYAPAAACAILPKMKQQVTLMPNFVNKAVANKFPIFDKVKSSGKEEILTSDHARRQLWTPSPNLKNGFIPWDVVALLVVTHPELFDNFEYHRVEFPGCDEGEPCDGTMSILEDFGRSLPTSSSILDFNGNSVGAFNHSGIVRIPHTIKNETLVLETMHQLLCQVPAKGPSTSSNSLGIEHITLSTHPPRIMWGFLSPILGTILVVISAVAVCKCRS